MHTHSNTRLQTRHAHTLYKFIQPYKTSWNNTVLTSVASKHLPSMVSSRVCIRCLFILLTLSHNHQIFPPSPSLPQCAYMLLTRAVANTVTHLCSYRRTRKRHEQTKNSPHQWICVTQQRLRSEISDALSCISDLWHIAKLHHHASCSAGHHGSLEHLRTQ